MKLGCHVSNSGNAMLLGSATEAINYGANAFMVYLGAPQNTYRKSFAEQNSEKMLLLLNENNISIADVIIHAPYIVNLGNPDIEKQSFAIDFLTKEIQLAFRIGMKVFVLHPGAHVGNGIAISTEYIVNGLKAIIKNTQNTDVVIALETMAGKGSEIGYNFEQLQTIISDVGSPRIKVCFDTCHVHDAGYDLINNYSAVINDFDKIIGIDKIASIHVNDSKNSCGSRKDRHENIGFGEIGFETLCRVIYDERFTDIPKILETPYVNDIPPYKHEIEMIKVGLFDPMLKQKIESGN